MRRRGITPRFYRAAAAAIHREPLVMHSEGRHGRRLARRDQDRGARRDALDYTASGMTTNVAARLAAVAEGGEIIVREATRDRLVLV
jgi:hypothetical protein